MTWAVRGLRHGIVTTAYPRRADDYGPGFSGAVTVTSERSAVSSAELAVVSTQCPTGAIDVRDSVPSVDRGACILCGRCTQLAPAFFSMTPALETSSLSRSALVVPSHPESGDALDEVRRDLHRRVKSLRRSIHIRHVDAGSDGSEEVEITALRNPIYDVQRLGIYFTATPRHADVLLVTGVGTAAMREPLTTTYHAMPHPKVVIAVGTDAVSGGIASPTYASGSGVGEILPVDVWVPGSPPSPFTILHALLLGTGLLSQEVAT
jgi:Ni,Fe-hydrogenase III small subunit/ferredoxin